MIKKHRGRGGDRSHHRFCVECGIHARPGTTRYCAGSYIEVEGVGFMICIGCRVFKPAEDKSGECRDCCRQRMNRERISEERQRRSEERQRIRDERERRSRRRAEREAWHQHAIALWGSDMSSCGEFDDANSDGEYA